MVTGIAALTFGTAGLRAQMGWGFARINVVTVMQTSQGLAEFLLAKYPRVRKGGVVVGYDGRHDSRKFGLYTAYIFRSKGITVYAYQNVVHTPMVPFAMKHLHAIAGVMITASHNPAEDNGYKVWGPAGYQINKPEDYEICSFIRHNQDLPQSWDVGAYPQFQETISRHMTDCYTRKLLKVIGHAPQLALRECPPFVYTALHGVGTSIMEEALEVIGYRDLMTPVERQARPDPDFPTVKYPNPEEKGALDLAKMLAGAKGISLIIANDPDADRFAAAEMVQGKWYQFTGDELGILLGEYIMTNHPGQEYTLVTTAVSSSMLSVIANRRGMGIDECVVEETLTGFRWIGEHAKTLKEKGKRVIFGYEEALGYMLPGIVWDKDGVAAALLFLRACERWWPSPYNHLCYLYNRYGYFQSCNKSFRFDSTDEALKAFEVLRIAVLGSERFAGRAIKRCRDMVAYTDTDTLNGLPVLPRDEATKMITIWLAPRRDGTEEVDKGLRITYRTSGTEPKIKEYVECRAEKLDWAQDSLEQFARASGGLILGR